MRVLHWFPDFRSGGGIAEAVAGLASAQARLGARVAVAACDENDVKDAPSAVEGIWWEPRLRVHAFGLTSRSLSVGDSERLRSFGPDVVHVHGEFNPDNLRVPRLFPRATIVVSPQGAFAPAVIRGSRALGKRLYCSLARALLYRRAVFHVLSPLEEEHVRALLPRAMTYIAPQASTRPALASGSSRRSLVRFLYVGRLDVQTKGLDVLVEAFALARRELGPGALELVLAGPDAREGRATLERLVAELGVSDGVRFTGELDGAGVARELASADVAVQLSRNDAFPVSVAEALCAGKPLIVSDAVGAASYDELARLPHVRVIPPDATDAAAALVSATREAAALAAAAQASADAVRTFFSWTRIATIHLDRYPAAQAAPAATTAPAEAR